MKPKPVPTKQAKKLAELSKAVSATPQDKDKCTPADPNKGSAQKKTKRDKNIDTTNIIPDGKRQRKQVLDITALEEDNEGKQGEGSTKATKAGSANAKATDVPAKKIGLQG